MKVGDLVRVTAECFASDLVGCIGIVIVIERYGMSDDFDTAVLSPQGVYIMDPIDLEVISESG